MTPERYARIDQVFQAALERDGEDRAAFLDRACAGDPELRAEVNALLAADDQAHSFIELPAVARIPELVAGRQSLIGQVIGSHKVIRRLGSGGMGDVYLAQDSRLDRRVALKVVGPGPVGSLSRRRFLREARLASALDHPNICTIYEVGEDAGQLFIAMLYVEGETLRELIGRSPLPVASIVSISLQVAQALAAAHAVGIIHRDIKSRNIIITRQGQAKVLDFGLAKPVHGRGGPSDELTQSGAVQGTPAYMSPEQARGLDADHRSDIFSLGVVMYEMATGRVPFQETSQPETLNAIIKVPHVAASALNADVPPDLSAIIDRAMVKEREQRYQSVSEIVEDLRRFAGSRGLAPSSLERVTVPYARRRRGRIVRTVSLGAILAGLMFASSALLLRDRYRSAPPPDPAAAHPIKAVAVLPFKPLVEASRDEALEMGMADTLITRLGSIREVAVRPTTAVRKYAKLEQDPIAAGREQRVDAVLDGSIQKADDRVRVTVRLIRVRDGAVLWTRQFDEPLLDIFTVQDAIAERVAGALTVSLTGEEQRRLTKRNTHNPEAYQAYVKGRYHWSRDTVEAIEKSSEYFSQAIQMDPEFAAAYAGLADSYIFLSDYGVISRRSGFEKAREAATRALELDDTLAEPHVSLAFLAQADWNWSEAERHYQRAIALNPNHAAAHHWYADMLAMLGRSPEAMAEAKRAIDLEPVSAAANANLATTLYLARQYDRSIEQLKTTLEIDPNFGFAHFMLGLVYVQKHRYDEALAAIEKAVALTGRPDLTGPIGYIHALAGRRDEAQRALDRMLEHSKRAHVPPVGFVVMYVGLGNKERAFQWLEEMVRGRSYHVRILKSDPLFDPLRSDPRFTDLLRRTGLL